MLLGRALGKLPARIDPRTLRLSKYLQADVSAPPPTQDWSIPLPENVGLYRNDELGICGLAAPAHLIQTWTAQNETFFVPPVDEVVKAYCDVGGYNPFDPATDRGTDMLSVLNYWRRTGIAGRKVRAFLKLDHDDITQIKIAIRLFGGVYVGASLPKRVLSQPARWTSIQGAARTEEDTVGSWGGHAMACANYDRVGVTFYTWGHRQRAHWTWFLEYVDEAYCVLSDDWFDASLTAPNGVAFHELAQDLRDIESA